MRGVSETALGRKDALRLEGSIAGPHERARVEEREAAVAVRIVYGGTVAYAALFVVAVVLHWMVFKTARFDLGNMAQAVWNTLHGHFLETTTVTGHQRSRL